MITLQQYVGKHSGSADWTPERQRNATILLPKVNALLDRYESETTREVKINPATGSNISGSSDGGFREQNCPQGSAHSSHKEGKGIDVYDPDNAIDNWITDEVLEEFGLYREAPGSTNHWCHLTDRPPPSGHRTFQP